MDCMRGLTEEHRVYAEKEYKSHRRECQTVFV